MTGYGAGESGTSSWRCVVEIRSVNQRFLDIRLRLPSQFSSLEAELKERVRKICKRGKVEGSIKLEQAEQQPALRLNPERAAQLVALSREFEQLSGQPMQFHARDLMSLEAVETGAKNDPPDGCKELIREAVSRALDGLDLMKEKEGQAMAVDIRERMELCSRHVQTIEQETSGLAEQNLKRANERIRDLTGGMDMDQDRLHQEIAILADRIDICEEIARLRAHLKHLEELLSEKEIGKKAEFLLQEINREINTVASKSNHSGVSRITVEVKSELEKMREQLQNIE